MTVPARAAIDEPAPPVLRALIVDDDAEVLLVLGQVV
jgi:hypothetical protein